MLLVAFAFAVMADPVSSVAYAIEAALRALHGDLALLLPTMAVVVGVVAVVTVGYHQMVARYPGGGGSAAAVGEAYGEGWSFIPVGAMVVDFALTIAISAAAAGSAIIAYLPALGPWRVELAVLVIAAVAGLSWFGHLGRVVFATMTLAFLALASAVLVGAWALEPLPAAPQRPVADGMAALGAVLLAFPVAMALATGVEAPASAIAQLDQLDAPGRRRFGRVTLWLTVGIIGFFTLGLAVQAARLNIGVPAEGSTQLADLARAALPEPLFAAFQAVTALLLTAAASSSFQAGPGLMKALAARTPSGAGGILPAPLATTNRYHTPYHGLAAFALVAAVLAVAAGGRDQYLVLFYAVSVFLGFLCGLAAMARLARRERRPRARVVNLLGAAVVSVTLVMNLVRGAPALSVAAALVLAAVLHRLWARSGRPAAVHRRVAVARCPVPIPPDGVRHGGRAGTPGGGAGLRLVDDPPHEEATT